MATASNKTNKHTVYLPADFVHTLQERALASGQSSYGAVQAFLRRAISTAIDEWKRRNAPSAASGSPQLKPQTALVEVPAEERAFYEQLIRYLSTEGNSSEQEWKQGLRRAVQAWKTGRR